jgi:hypothetical protein
MLWFVVFFEFSDHWFVIEDQDDQGSTYLEMRDFVTIACCVLHDTAEEDKT